MKKQILKLILGTLMGLSFVASSYATDLMGVFKQALVSDQTFQSARATYLAATEAYPQARAALLPAIGFTAEGEYSRVKFFRINLPSPPAPLGQVGQVTVGVPSYGYTLNISQPVFNFTSWANLCTAKYSVKQASAIYAAAAQNLLLRVSTAYFDVLEAKETLRFTESEKRATGRQLDQAKERFKVGLDAITSVYDAQASYDAVVAKEIAAKNSVVNNKEELREITGVYYDHIAKLKRAMPLLTPEPNDVETWVHKGERYNFSLQAAHFAMDAARSSIKAAFGGHLPVLNLVGDYDRERRGGFRRIGFLNTRTISAGVQVSLPIYQGGLVVSQVHEAQAVFEDAMAQLENTHRQVSVGLRQTYNSITAGISKIKADKQAIVSRESSLNSTEAALKVGTRTIVDLLNAQQQLFQTQTILATDQFAYINNTLQFKALAGTLSVHDLQALNTWLEGTQARRSPRNVYRVHMNTEALVIGHKHRHKRMNHRMDRRNPSKMNRRLERKERKGETVTHQILTKNSKGHLHIKKHSHKTHRSLAHVVHRTHAKHRTHFKHTVHTKHLLAKNKKKNHIS